MVHYYISLATGNIAAMSHPNTNPVPNPENSPTTGFNAQSQMGLPEVLQMCCLSRRSGQITFRSGESYGFIYIQQGRVLHALCGSTEGEEAIYSMLPWPGGGFSLDEDILPHKKTVSLTWEQLLFEGARRADHGLNKPTSAAPTITTAEPLSVRIHESQPRLIITRPDLPESTQTIESEYTHVGRSANNEICLPYPPVSSRHCMFIQSGPDVVLRDLNSSNGTLVNDELINEVILRPGDVIQVGSVTMKFEPGVKRPKLNAPAAPPIVKESGYLKKQGTSGALFYQTTKLPTAPERKIPKPVAVVKDDSAYVKGESAISYDAIAKPQDEKQSPVVLYVVIAVLVIAAIAGACYYFLVLQHGGH